MNNNSSEEPKCVTDSPPTINKSYLDSQDEILRGVVLDKRDTTGNVREHECFCFDQRKLIHVRTNEGLCPSWIIMFSIKSRDGNGTCDVNIKEIITNSAVDTKGDVVLGRDGVVRIRTYVGASKCVQHESYKSEILWSDKFRRVLRNEEMEGITKLAIYSTYVKRDTSEMAVSNEVAFRICDVLKKIDDVDVIRSCRDQMMEDQENWRMKIVKDKTQEGKSTIATRNDLLTASKLMSDFHIDAEASVIGVIVHTVSEKLKVFECFCLAQRKLLKIRTDKGVCKSWTITFSIKAKDSDDIYDVIVEKADGSRKKEVILGRDGGVRMLTYVGASKCIHHESYQEKILWSDKFERVLYSDHDDKLTKLAIYSTYVRRDFSRMAASYGVAFQICDVLKPVDDKDIIKCCRKQMHEDQEFTVRRLAMISSAKEKTDEKSNEANLGQAGFGVDEGPYSARVYDDVHQERKFKFPKGRQTSSPELDEKDLITPPLMLCVKTDHGGTEAWSVELGLAFVEDTFVRQTKMRLKKGDWFYGSIRCRGTGSRKVYYVKKVHSPADPLGYTYWMNNSIEMEMEVRGDPVENVHLLLNGKALMPHPHVGRIEIAEEDYKQIFSKRVVAILRFNMFNPGVPWTFVGFISVLAPYEEFPILSPDCLVSYRVRKREQAIQGTSRGQTQARESGDFGPYGRVD